MNDYSEIRTILRTVWLSPSGTQSW